MLDYFCFILPFCPLVFVGLSLFFSLFLLFFAFAGSTLLAVFGLPPVAHEDDPARALSASIRMRETLKVCVYFCLFLALVGFVVIIAVS